MESDGGQTEVRRRSDEAKRRLDESDRGQISQIGSDRVLTTTKR